MFLPPITFVKRKTDQSVNFATYSYSQMFAVQPPPSIYRPKDLTLVEKS